MRPKPSPTCWVCAIMIEPTSMFAPVEQPGPPTDRMKPPAATLEWVPVVPDNAPDVPPLRGSRRWWYNDRAGRRSFTVDRYEPKHDGDRKSFVPVTLWQDKAGVLNWQKKHPPAPRPLYRLDELAGRPDAPVLVVEGEKAADTAARMLPEFTTTTSSGGAEASGKSDWSPVAGRDVVVWLDHDEAGRRYASDVARLALEAGASSARIVQVPGFWPVGWDLADALPEGVTIATVREMVAAAKAAESEASPRIEALRPAEPVPLVRPLPPAEPYPVDALGSQLAGVAGAIQEIVQSPAAMCANSVLAVATLSAQAHIDVELPIGSGSVRPVSSLSHRRQER